VVVSHNTRRYEAEAKIRSGTSGFVSVEILIQDVALIQPSNASGDGFARRSIFAVCHSYTGSCTVRTAHNEKRLVLTIE